MSDSFPRQHARTRRFTLGRPRSFSVGADAVLFLRSAAGDDPVHDLWRLDLATGQEQVVVRARDLVADDAELPAAERARRERTREQGGGIVAYATDRDQTLAAFALGGRLHTVDLVTREVREEVVEQQAVVDPRPSPSGSRVAYVGDGGVHVLVPGGPATTMVSGEGAQWGLADFVAAEELQRQRGFWWSPQGDALAVARVDDDPVGTWHVADPANPATRPVEHRYPAAGTANPEVRLAVMEVDERRRRDLRWDHDELPYLVDVRWGPDGPLTAVLLDRSQRRHVVMGFDPDSGAPEVLAEHVDPAWVDVVPGSVRWLPDGRLVTVADVDGLGDGGTRTVLVDGEPVGPAGLQVHQLLDVRDGVATLVAATDPRERHLVRLDLDGGAVTMLTDGAAVHAGAVGAGGVVVSRAPLDAPPSVTVRTGDGRELAVACHDEEPLVAPAPELLELGPERLHAALLLPADHDGGPLPVLLDPYGGPHAQRVLASRNAYLTSQWFADRGWAVLVVDGRGTPGRGPVFERAVRGDLSRTLDDQVAGLEDLLARDDRLDGDRVAIRGWSFGGYLAGLAALRRPDLFRAAVLGAPVTDWRLYDTAYTERYLGHPDDAPEAYRRSSLVEGGDLVEAAPLPDGRRAPGMLLIHGMADDNVVAAHTLRLSTALLAAGRPHEVLPLSGVTHMTPQEVVAENLLLLQLDFLERHVLA